MNIVTGIAQDFYISASLFLLNTDLASNFQNVQDVPF